MADGGMLDRVQLQARGDVPAPCEPVAGRVLASWERSQGYGVPLEDVDPVFTGAVDQESLFFQCGNEVLTGLHATLHEEPVSLMLTDSEGLVLNRLSREAGLLRAMDDVHLAPGFAFSEREVGTNGLGLALADRAPALVRAEEHYSTSLCGYTCAAAPVVNPVTGQLEGSVNLTTWSRSSSGLLLALAQSAAASTSALMLARSQGRTPRPLPRGAVYRVEAARLEPGSGSLAALSGGWTEGLSRAADALAGNRMVVAVGEPGSGRATLLAQALRRFRPRARILAATPPAAADVEAWLSLWTPELGKPDTSVIVCDADTLPSWAGQRLRDLLDRERARRVVQASPAAGLSLAFTAEHAAALPAALGSLVEAVVPVAPLRERPDDVLELAAHLARRTRGRDVGFTPAAERALRNYGWPGNADQLAEVVRAAAAQADPVDVRHLPSELLSGSQHRLTRLEAVQREEIVRALTAPGATVKRAAEALGMSRATIYRKIAYYDIRVPGRG